MPHAPGLDGIRGLAVLAVLAYHLDLPWAGGGFLGVEVFFTLSGFLITQLVLAELHRNGRLDVGAFVRARARRLLPALLVCVVATLVAYRLLRPAEVSDLRRDVLAAPAFLQNWRLVLSGLPYSASTGPPSPLQHLWSLAVEAQLYVLWPVLLVGVLVLLSRGTAVTLTLLLAWLSAVAMASIHSPDGGDVAYYVTPARASGFLVGAALALAWRPEAWERRLPRAVDALLDAAGLAALVTLAVAVVAVSEFDAALYENAGFLRTGVAAAALVVVAARGRGITCDLLASRPLTVAGRRSYGLYLYHWPVFVLGDELLPGAGLAQAALCLAVTAALTEASHRWVETPIRRGGLRALGRRFGLSSPMSPVGLMVSATAVAVALVIGTSPPAGIATAAVDAAAAAPEEGGAPSGGPAADLAAAAPAPAPEVPAPADAAPEILAPAEEAPAPAEPAAPAAAPKTVPPDEPSATGSALVVGDSIALGSADALRAALGGDTTVDARVGRQFAASPAIVASWARAHGGPVVVALGANGTVSPRDLEAVVAASGSRRVVLVGVAVARRWRDGNNAALRATAARHPQVAFVDWAALVASHPGVLGPDGVHPGPRGRALLAGAVAEAARG